MSNLNKKSETLPSPLYETFQSFNFTEIYADGAFEKELFCELADRVTGGTESDLLFRERSIVLLMALNSLLNSS